MTDMDGGRWIPIPWLIVYDNTVHTERDRTNISRAMDGIGSPIPWGCILSEEYKRFQISRLCTMRLPSLPDQSCLGAKGLRAYRQVVEFCRCQHIQRKLSRLAIEEPVLACSLRDWVVLGQKREVRKRDCTGLHGRDPTSAFKNRGSRTETTRMTTPGHIISQHLHHIPPDSHLY